MIAATAIALAGAAALALSVAYGAIGPWLPASGAVGLALPGRMAAHYLAAFVGMHTLAPEYPELLRFVERVQGGDMTAILTGSGATLALAMAVAAALTACLRARNRGDGVFAFVSAWTMSVLVALSLWGGLHEPGADRHAYLLLAPAGVALAALLSRRSHAFPATPPGAVLAAVAFALLGWASASRAQMLVWQSERTLWTYASASSSASPRAHANMARSLAADARYRAAARQMNIALAAAPGDSLLHVGRAALRCAQGRRFLAHRDLKTAQQLGAPLPLIADVAQDCGSSAT